MKSQRDLDEWVESHVKEYGGVISVFYDWRYEEWIAKWEKQGRIMAISRTIPLRYIPSAKRTLSNLQKVIYNDHDKIWRREHLR